jgi:predicted acyltransferase
MPTGKNNGMAVAALCCGIAGFLCIIPAILGIIFGFVAKNQIRDSGYTQRGDGMATWGIVLGIVWIALTIILLATGGVNVSTN